MLTLDSFFENSWERKKKSLADRLATALQPHHNLAKLYSFQMSNCQVLKLHQTLSEIVSEFCNSQIETLQCVEQLLLSLMDLLIWPFTDDNECALLSTTENVTGICGPHATCNNTVGNYYCTCVSGFTANGKQEFQTNDGTYCKGKIQPYTTEWAQKVSGHKT